MRYVLIFLIFMTVNTVMSWTWQSTPDTYVAQGSSEPLSLLPPREFECKNCDLMCYECSFNSWNKRDGCECQDVVTEAEFCSSNLPTRDGTFPADTTSYYNQDRSEPYLPGSFYRSCDQSFRSRGFDSEWKDKEVTYMCGMRGWERDEDKKVIRRRCLAYLSEPPKIGCTNQNMTLAGYVLTELICDTDGCNASISESRSKGCKWFEKLIPSDHSEL